ncbi:MAG TPA: universal stress protein [Terriglobales bacterium]|nr:universal stress protein [Terriglobales bacterium]
MSACVEVPREANSVRLKSILLATDFSAASEKAFEYATAIARRHDAKISVVHVIPESDAPLVPELSEELQWQYSTREMETLAKRDELKQTRHQLLLRRGSVWNVLSHLMREERVDLLVLGTHGRGGLEKLLVGSIAEEMVRLAACPVLTVGPNSIVSAALTGEFHKVLFATEFGPASEKAVPYALFFARESGGELILLYVVRGEPLPLGELGTAFYDDEVATTKFEDEVMLANRDRLEDLLPLDARMMGCKTKFMVEFGVPTAEILNAAEKHQPNLMVIGANSVVSARASAHLSWAVSHELICHAKCPVLTIRA